MIEFVKDKNKWIYIIVFIALMIRVAYFISVKPWEDSFVQNRFSATDAKEYHMLAEKTIQDGKYPVNFLWDTFRTPVFPFYVTFFYFIFGIKPYLIFASNIILNLVSVLYVYLFCLKLFENKNVSFIAAILFAFEPNTIKMMTEFGPDTLHSTLLIISAFYFIKGLKDKKYIPFIISSVLFGITTLTRPVNLYFYILCLAFVLFYPKEKISRKIILGVIFISVYYATLIPWMYRNYKEYEYFSTNAYQGNAVIWYAGVTKSVLENKDIIETFMQFDNALKDSCDKYQLTNPFEIDKQKQKIGYNYIIHNPGVYSVIHLKGMINFFIAPLNNENYSLSSKIVLGTYFAFIYSFLLIGIWGLIKQKLYFNVVMLFSVIFYFSFLTGVVGLARYRLPSTAFIVSASAFGIYLLIEKINKRKALKNRIDNE